MTRVAAIRRKRRKRRGVVLVLFVMLVFGIMAIAGLCIDLGIVHTTQRQMQPAVDSAALEGLRGVDLLSDQDRRTNASQFVAWTFDDDMNPQTPNNQFGAGPLLQLSGGITDSDPTLAASQTLSVPTPSVYQPQQSGADGTAGLELNLQDIPSGDMVAGQFHTGESATESNTFERADFTPYSAATSPDRDAFLVRMRRSRNASGLEQVAGVSTTGPSLPLLFARGAMISKDLDATSNPFDYSPRENGVTVRATAIAEGRPALYVGPQYPSQYPDTVAQPPQMAPFALPSTYWNSVAAGGTVTLNLDAATGTSIDSTPQGFPIRSTTLRAAVATGDTTLRVASATFNVGDRITIGTEVMQVTATGTDASGTTLTVVRQAEGTRGAAGAYAASAYLTLFASAMVGQQTGPLESSLPDGLLFPAAAQPVRVYVPLFDTIAVGTSGTDSVQVIVGFGVADAWTPEATNLRQFSLRKVADFHALVNASASPAAVGPTWDALEQSVATTFPQLAKADLSQMLVTLMERSQAVDSPLLSPVLVR